MDRKEVGNFWEERVEGDVYPQEHKNYSIPFLEIKDIEEVVLILYDTVDEYKEMGKIRNILYKNVRTKWDRLWQSWYLSLAKGQQES